MVEDRFQKGVHPRAKQPGLNKVSTQGSEPARTRFRPSPYQPQCPAGTPPSTPPVPPSAGTPPPAGEQGYTELIQRILEQHDTMQQILSKMTEVVTILGTAPKPEDKYYDTPQTIITVPTPTQPNSPDSFSVLPATPGYQSENVYAALGRIAPKITVINDGTATLFVISSPDGKTWSSENTILTGEARTLWNVWELRIRSPLAGVLGPPTTGGVYRVTERDYWLPYAKIISVGGSIIITLAGTTLTSQQNLALPLVANTNWLGADLVPVNTPTTFRIMVSVSIGGNFSAVITNGGNTQTLLFNAIAGPALVAGALYTFEMLVAAGDTVNFRYSAAAPGATIQKLIVEEVDAAVA